jgi:hypothetical protein
VRNLLPQSKICCQLFIRSARLNFILDMAKQTEFDISGFWHFWASEKVDTQMDKFMCSKIQL